MVKRSFEDFKFTGEDGRAVHLDRIYPGENETLFVWRSNCVKCGCQVYASTLTARIPPGIRVAPHCEYCLPPLTEGPQGQTESAMRALVDRGVLKLDGVRITTI